MFEQLTGSWLCWAIVFLAMVAYQQLWSEYFVSRTRSEDGGYPMDNTTKREFSGILIGALPLLGLLGTIIGLLDCFTGIATEGGSSELVSSGIGDALLTTQMGLVCAIPGWLLLSYVRSQDGKHTPIFVENRIR